jgi:tetratricopeptide (TPR) repeat protein
MRKAFIRLAFAALCAGIPLYGQGEPPRPDLPRGADANDWEAYFDEGARRFDRFPTQAARAFYWAARLDPTRAEPLFGQWATFYATDWSLWLSYVEEEERFFQRPDVARTERIRELAYYRNPFVHRGFEAVLWSRLQHQLRWDDATRAFMKYGEADFEDAVDGFGRSVRRDPVRNVRLRFWRALAFVGNRQPDSAGVELTHLLATLRSQDETRLDPTYESKAELEYALGMLHDARGRPEEARRAWERALEEDLTMYPARAALARMALRQRNAAEAVEHLAQVVEIAPGDPVMHFEYGNALAAAARGDDAISAYGRASQLEPYWAEPYLRMGLVLRHTGQSQKAAAALRTYLERAPRRDAEGIRRATEALAAVGQGG